MSAPQYLQRLPNQLTVLRIVLAAAFFVTISLYDQASPRTSWLWTSIGLFIVAAVTDFFDGYLARKYDATSVFGRIMDPFADKLLVMGALICLAGPNFASMSPDLAMQPSQAQPGPVTGVSPWMVVLILGRELLVTSIRGEMERRGVAFGAKMAGKLKAVLQMIVVPAVLAIIAIDPQHVQQGPSALVLLRDGLVWATVIVTLISGVPYVTAAVKGSSNG